MRALILLALSSGCTSLLGITDPSPAGPVDSAVDSNIDSNIDAPPPCAPSITLKAEVSSDVGAAGSDFAIGRYDTGLTDDIVVALGTSAVILHGNSAGAFGGDGMKITVPTAAVGVVSDDFDTDADDDLAFWTPTSVVVRRLNRTLNPPVEAEQPLTGPFTNVTRVLAENLDGALRPDLFVYDATAGSRVYTSNLGNPGTFARDANLVGSGADELVLMRQIDDAQRDDALFASGTTAKIALQTTSFSNPVNVATGLNSKGVALGNFDTDALPDLVVSTAQGIVLFRQNAASPGTFTMHGMISPVQSATPMLVADINNDGNDDILTPTAAILQCTPVGGVGVFSQVEALSAAQPAKMIDVTGDGKPDLVRLDGTAIKVRVNQ